MSHTMPIIRPTLPDFDGVIDDLRAVWDSGMLTTARNVAALEQEIADRCEVPEAVGVSSCTSGLILLLQALELPRGAEVIVPTFTFAATAHAVVWNGLKPIFADCDPEDLTLDLRSARSLITHKTGAIMATCIFGTPPDLDGLAALSRAHDLPLVLDSAQGMGACYRGHPLGGYGVAEVFSMSPTKVITGAEGGMITTRDPKLAARLRSARDHGKADGGEDMDFVGLSARLSEFHAVIARHGLRNLDHYVADRCRLIGRYQRKLRGLAGIRFPAVPSGRSSSANYMVLRIDGETAPASRDMLHAYLKREGIQSKRSFFPAVHQQRAYSKINGKRSLPNAERAAAECLALPLYAHMEMRDVDRVVSVLRDAVADAVLAIA